MGKVKRFRQKLHIANKEKKQSNPTEFISQQLPDVVMNIPNDNLFAGLNIDINSLKTKLNDDVQSVKSFKSLKSERGGNTILSKKEKLKMRKAFLLNKIDAVIQAKKKLKTREKRKKTIIIGDTNPLHDALPSLESLLKNRPNIHQIIPEVKKKKGIDKARRRKKEVIQGVKIFKSVLNNKTYQKSPLETISQHIQSLVKQEKQKI